ncbi:putative fungal specific transcription factor domain-containing protein [Rosellinia necatrix]|uniref:Putative fungal specific transcription factor domain-containing protein n=1 Tax=Rosellinia necatrix TaxID=77044 RepID=A0A1W2TUD5_ROSNE|nr:putative fungal specific transcription factor domain-containing protein [Rosellinia necatrix]
MSSLENDEFGESWSRRDETPGSFESAGRPKRRREDSSSRRGPTQEHGVMRDGNDPGLPRFIGSSSGIHLIRTVYDVLARAHPGPHRRRPTATKDVVPGEDDQLIGPSPASSMVSGASAAAHFWRPDEIVDTTGPAGLSPSFNQLTEWSDNYVRNWHPAFPLLHGPELLAMLERLSMNGIEGLDQAEATIVRSIMSISLVDSRQLGNRRSPFPSNLVFLDQEDISTNIIFILASPASMRNIQAATCLELFLVSILRFNMASRLGGIVTRMAFNLGLHRCPSRFPNFSPHAALIRKRLWWSIYCLERAVCQTLGLPLSIRDDDIDVCLPLHEMHTGAGEPDPARALGDRDMQDQLRLLELLSKHARLRGLILELRNKSLSSRHDSAERAMRVQAQVKRWVNELYDLTGSKSPLSTDAGDDQSEGATNDPEITISSSHYTLLSILQHELTLSLYRPLLASDPEGPASQSAFQECINASRAIIDITVKECKAPEDQDSSQQAIHLLWPSVTWSVWMSCFVLAYAALEGVIAKSSARRYASRALRVLKLVSLRGSSWPEKCTEAIEHLISALDIKPAAVDRSLIGQLPNKRHRILARTVQTGSAADPSGTTGANDGRACQTILTNVPHAKARWHPREQYAFGYPTVNQHPLDSYSIPVDMQDPSLPSTMQNVAGYFLDPATGYTPEPTNFGNIYNDPLIALDFANFAQMSSGTDTTTFGIGSHS